MNFRQFPLDAQILHGIDKLGFVKPTPIQEQAILPAIEGRDILGLAQTGTGKTAAFVIPILQKLTIPSSKSGIRFLVIAPTRELAQQIQKAFVDLGKYMGIQCVTIYGGVSKLPQLSGIRNGAQIVVACPGRLLDHLEHGDIHLSSIDVLVLDEADTMCDMGFLPSIRSILKFLPVNRQTLLFSATMPTVIRSLVMKLLKNPTTVQIGANAPAKTVSHAIYPVPDKLKKNLTVALLNQTATGQVLVFTRTKYRARILAVDLAAKSFKVAALQGNMSQNARKQAMDGFRSGKFNILVATDIAAHGIDVPEISHVINFDFPLTVDDYTHRIGRTGRADQSGEAFSLAGISDGPIIRQVEKELGRPIERRSLSGFDYEMFAPENQVHQQNLKKGDSSRRGKVQITNSNLGRPDKRSSSVSTGSNRKATPRVRHQGDPRVGSAKRKGQVIDGKAGRFNRSSRPRKSPSNSRNRID